MIPYANDKQENEFETGDDFLKQEDVKWYSKIILNRQLKVVIAFVVFSIAVPLLVYHFLLTSTLDLPPSDGYSAGTCILPRARRLPCGYGYTNSSEHCHLQCCYDVENHYCFHRLPSRFSYIIDRPWQEQLNFHPRVATEPFSHRSSLASLRMMVDEVSISHMVFYLYNSAIVQPQSGRVQADRLYEYQISTPELDITVNAGDRTILQMNRGPLVAAENIWEISFKITNETMFGLGEIPLSPGTTKVIYKNKDDFTPLPLIFARLEETFHAVLIENTSPTEIQVLADNQLVIRSITDTGLKFHVFVGPTPEDIMKDVMRLTGDPPKIPFWMFEPHYCSDSNTGISQQYEQLTAFLAQAESSSLPVGSHCGVGPVVLDAVRDKEKEKILDLGAQSVINAGVHFVPHLSPYIKYERVEPYKEVNDTKDKLGSIPDFYDIMIRNPANVENIYVGSAQNHAVVYVDYNSSRSVDFLSNFWPFVKNVSGLVLENDWPLDESELEMGNVLPYVSKAFKNSFLNTLPWNSLHAAPHHHRPYHVDHHNEYGDNFARAVTAFSGNPAVQIISTSKWMNSSILTNRQNVETSWTNLKKELVTASLSGITGNWFYASPICGDRSLNLELQSELCLKWYLASTFFPLIKIESNGIRRDPLAFEGNTRSHMILALQKRRSLLSYFYTVLQNGPLLRPMFYQYPKSAELHEITTQYSVGDHLLVVPNLLPQQMLVNAWLPPGVWYEMWGGVRVAAVNNVVTMPTATTDMLVLVQGGSIISLQEERHPTATDCRLKSPFTLIVALDCELLPDSYCFAQGHITFSDELNVHVEATPETLTLSAAGNDWEALCTINATWAHTLKDIRLYGLSRESNNHDEYRQVIVNYDLCKLEVESIEVINIT